METLNEVFTEHQVDEVSGRILKLTIEKIKSELSDNFYNEMDMFIHEHYENASNAIHRKLIDEIVEEFVKDPKDYRFLKLRQKLFNENKDLLIGVLTDEAIEKSVEAVIWQHTDSGYQFEWKWKGAIVGIMCNNWDKFKDDDRVNAGLLREVVQLKSMVETLEKRLRDAEGLISE